MKNLWTIFMVIAALSATAQPADSLRPQMLEEIVFEGTPYGQDTVQSFYRANASATTESILSRMKGVTLIRRGAFGQEPVFRSLQGGQINVTIDGMKVFGACTDKMDPVSIYIEPQNLSAIQALGGTQGAEFGSTFGGTLNMRLAGPTIREQRFSARVGTDFQTAANAFSYFSRANISARRSAYRLSATYRKSGNYRAGGGQEIAHSQYEKLNVAVSGKWTLGKNDTLQADAIGDGGYNIGFPALPMDVRRAVAGIFAATYHRTTPWHLFHHFTAKAYHNTIAHSMDDASRNGISMHMSMPGKSQTSGLLVEGPVRFFRHHTTTVKAEYFINTMMGEMTMYAPGTTPMYMQTAPRSRRQSASLFMRQQFRINDRHKAVWSWRGDVIRDDLVAGTGRSQWEVFEPHLRATSFIPAGTVSVGYDVRLTPHIRVELQSGYGQRPATLNERYGLYLFNRFDGYDYIGNPGLKTENAISAEATINFFGAYVEVQATPYYQKIYHYILGEIKEGYAPMTVGAHGVKQYRAKPSAHLTGLDVMILGRPLRRTQGIATVKYTQGRSSTGIPLPLIPPWKAVVSLRHDLHTINLQVEWEWAAAQHRVNASAAEQPTPAWSMLSLRTGWKINAFFQCSAGAENLLDRRYREHLDWGGIPRPGKNLYVNAVYTF